MKAQSYSLPCMFCPFFIRMSVDKIGYFVPLKLPGLYHLLFAAYLILFAWLITRIKFFTRSGLTSSQLIFFFLLKVMAGIFYGWIGVYYGELAQMLDTWVYHYESLQEYQLLLRDPGEFFGSIFRNTYEGGYTNFLVSKNSFWNDLKANFLIKVLALFHFASFGNYYINVVFYSFLTLFGPVAIYRVMAHAFPTSRIAVLLATFLVPSFIYWTSGLHKDGLIFLGFALMCYQLYFGLQERRFPFYRVCWLLVGFSLVLIFRNFLILVVIPALLAWVLAERMRYRPLYTYLAVYGLSLLVFFGARFLHPKLDFPEAVVLKQKEFLSLGGGSAVTVAPLQASLGSFVQNAPQAFSLSVIRPYPTDVRHLLSLAAAVEINLILLLLLVLLFLRKKVSPPRPFLLFCLFFSFSLLMMVGYSVNILGAIVRYRSIIFPFLIVPLMAAIDWNRISALLFPQNIK
jgi:hypothetical protein